MNYQITITKTEDNPIYKEQIKEYRNPYGSNFDKVMPQREVVKNVLMCELNEDQFKKVKAEVMKTFE